MSTLKMVLLTLFVKLAHDFGVAFLASGLVVLGTTVGFEVFGAVLTVTGALFVATAAITSLVISLTEKD